MRNNYILLTISIVCYGFWNFAQKIAVRHIHPLHIACVNSVMAMILFPIYISLVNTQVKQSINLPGILWAAAAYFAAMVAAFAFSFNLRGGSEVGTTSVLISTSPIITFILAVIFIHESITITKLLGIALVIGGMVVLGR